MSKSKAVSDGYLMSKWSECVRKIWGCCVVCGNPVYEDLEAHHIVHRRHWILKWFYGVGLAVCSPMKTGKECHKFMDSLDGKDKAERLIIGEHGIDTWDYIKKMEHMIRKQFLVNYGMSDNEFRKYRLEQLKVKLELLEG